MRIAAIAGVGFALCVSGAGGQGIPNGPPPTSVQTLSKMAGCWHQDTSSGATIDEMWMALSGSQMLGVSRTVGRGRVVEYEFMRIQFDGPGVTFFAKLPEQPETAFRLITVDAKTAVFENAAHDFPQRVIYSIDGGTLTGRIEGTQNGRPALRPWAFGLRPSRMGCPSP